MVLLPCIAQLCVQFVSAVFIHRHTVIRCILISPFFTRCNVQLCFIFSFRLYMSLSVSSVSAGVGKDIGPARNLLSTFNGAISRDPLG